jgi:O-antigen/teichoic acid export membrane protein
VSASHVVARNAGLQVVAETISKVASLVLYAVMARSLGQAGFGHFTFAFSLAGLFVVFAAPDVEYVLTRDVARDRSALPGMFWNALGLKLVLGVIAVALAVVVAAIWEDVPELPLAVGLLGIGLLGELLAKVPYATFLAYDDMRPVATTVVLQRLVTAAAGIAVLAAGGGLAEIAAVFAASSLGALALAVWRLDRAIGVPPVRLGGVAARHLFTSGLPLGISAVFTATLFRIDVVILAWLDDAEAVGLYGAAYRLLDATLFLSYSLVAALLPMLSRLSRASTPPIAQAFAAGAKVLAAVLFPLGAGAALFAEPIMRLVYGEDFTEGATALRLLGGTIALFGISYLSSAVLVAQDRQRVIPWVTGVVAAENIALNFALIPSLSLDGAALATTLTELTRAAALTWLAIGATGRISAARILLGPLAGCAGMVAAWLIAGDGVVGIVLALLAYPAVLVAFERRLHPDDLRMIVGVVLRRRVPIEAS